MQKSLALPLQVRLQVEAQESISKLQNDWLKCLHQEMRQFWHAALKLLLKMKE